MLNSQEAPASFSIEVRQWDQDPYLVGPTVSVAADGKVTAGDRMLGEVPLGEWVHVDIAFALGEGAAKTYEFTLRVPGREPIVAEIPFRSPGFESVTWLGIMSNSNAEAVFYLDNLKLGAAEELEQPPKRKPRPPLPAHREPANDQMLLGHWKFDEGEGYIAGDSSGNQNDGEVWTRWAKGDFGHAVFCDAAAATVEVPDNATLRFGKSDFSIDLWIYPTQLSIDSQDARRRFMEKSRFPDAWWNLNITADGKPFLEMRDENKVSCAPRPDGAIPENAWSHLAVVADRAQGKIRYYLNGKLDSARDIPSGFTGSLDVDGDLSIGSRWQPFVGMLDEVKIFRKALTEDEIRASYEKEKGRRGRAGYEIVE